jgi:uncharacterized protein YdeI (YjbR/CyaY-like superfamily)
LKPTFMRSPTTLREWFDAHHEAATEIWVGFYKRHTGEASVTWPEAVDEALCVGWIDGVRQSLDNRSYGIRFTPRRTGSIWSAVNIKRVAALTADGRMQPRGLAIFAARDAKRAGLYAYENRPRRLEGSYAAALRKDRAAWAFYQAQPPWYQRTATWWVMSAKKEETRQRRLAALIVASAGERRLGAVDVGGKKSGTRDRGPGIGGQGSGVRDQNNPAGKKNVRARSASAKSATKRARKPRTTG